MARPSSVVSRWKSRRRYSKLKGCVRLLFWSGQSFEEDELKKEGSFRAAEIRYASVEQVNRKNLKRWLAKAREIQWDYKNIVRRKGGCASDELAGAVTSCYNVSRGRKATGRL